MARGRMRRQWDQTAAVLALIANCHRDPKKRGSPYRPEEFNPFAEDAGRGGMKLTASNLNALRGFFGG